MNLFLVSLDDTRTWFRYHHLFRDLLRHRLEQQHSDLIPWLHLRASHWFEQNGWTNEAIHHALQAHDYPRTTSLNTTHALAILRNGRISFPAPSRYPGGVLTAVGTSFVDEWLFRGVFLGLLLTLNLPDWSAARLQNADLLMSMAPARRFSPTFRAPWPGPTSWRAAVSRLAPRAVGR